MASRELNILITAKNLASSTLKGIKGDLNDLGGIGRKAGRNLAANFERGLIVAGAGLAGFTTLAVRTAMDFEDAFSGVIKTVDEAELAAAGLSFGDLLDEFRAMAREMPIAFEELAAIGEAAGALGIAAKDIDEFTETVAKLSVTTDLSADQASTALGHLGTILGLTGQDYEDLADALVALGNDGASTESQIIDIAERFAAAGNIAGLTKEEILALASTTASMGVEAEAAGSSLSRLFNQTTTNIGVGNKKAEAFADALGMTFSEFKKSWDTDALGTFQSLLEHLNELDQFEGAALLKDLGVTGVRDINAIQLLAGGYSELTDQLETARSAQGALNEEASKKFATTASQVERFKNVLRDAGYVIGKELLPIVNDLLTDFTNFMAQEENQEKLKQFAKDFADNLRGAADWLKSLDWDKIIQTFSTLAGFGKSLLEAFLGMPSWVQTAVLTGWGLNKLTGGALGDLLGKGLVGGGKGLFGGLRGSTPATPVYTKEVGLPGTGGPGGAGKTGGKFPLLPALTAIAVPLILSGSDAPASAEMENRRLGLMGDIDDGLITMADAANKWRDAYGAETANPFAGGIDVNLPDEIGITIGGGNNVKFGRTRNEAQVKAAESFDQAMLQRAVKGGVSTLPDTAVFQGELGKVAAKIGILPPILGRQERQLQAAVSSDRAMLQYAGTQSSHLSAIKGIEGGNAGRLEAIKNKKTSVTALINTTVNVSLQEWQRVTVSNIRANSNSGGFI